MKTKRKYIRKTKKIGGMFSGLISRFKRQKTNKFNSSFLNNLSINQNGPSTQNKLEETLESLKFIEGVEEELKQKLKNELKHSSVKKTYTENQLLKHVEASEINTKKDLHNSLKQLEKVLNETLKRKTNASAIIPGYNDPGKPPPLSRSIGIRRNHEIEKEMEKMRTIKRKRN
jgi:hypothetical protein